MTEIILLSVAILFLIAMSVFVFLIFRQNARIAKTLSHHYALIVKIQTVLKSKYATNAVAENAEMIYQDLLQNLIPIMAAIDVMPRNTAEHPLWRAIGGIMDDYAKNPFVLEKLRRAIKLDTDVARAANNYLARADGFLTHLNNTTDSGILSAAFTDGLLGQSMAFFEQARQLAQSNG